MTTRRGFVKTIGTSAAGVFTSNLWTGKIWGANDKIAVGFIGIGKQGRGLLRNFGRNNQVAITAVCDVAQPLLDGAITLAHQLGHQPAPYADFRDLIQNRSINAVIIATPDHWHAYMTVEACKKGKDVYVEKPISTDVSGGRKMVDAARKYGRVVQVGTQQRSWPHFQNYRILANSGVLGKVTEAVTFSHGGDIFAQIGKTAETNPPTWLNWPMWLGPAARPEDCQFTANRFGLVLNSDGTLLLDQNGDPPYWSRFRVTDWRFAGGMVTDWGIHLLDILQWIYQPLGPRWVSAEGGIYCLKNDDRVTPDTIKISCNFPDLEAVWTFEHRSCGTGTPRTKTDRRGRHHDIRIFGSQASIMGDRDNYELFVDDWYEQKLKQENKTLELPVANGRTVPPTQRYVEGDHLHVQNFLDCIRSREKPIADIEGGHRSTVMCLLGNASYRVGRRLEWDPVHETTPDQEAMEILHRPETNEWKIIV